jgi:hypothetical protein
MPLLRQSQPDADVAGKVGRIGLKIDFVDVVPHRADACLHEGGELRTPAFDEPRLYSRPAS